MNANEDVSLKLISYPSNRGKGGAVRLGMLMAQGNRFLMMDADLATDLDDYPRLNRKVN